MFVYVMVSLGSGAVDTASNEKSEFPTFHKESVGFPIGNETRDKALIVHH